MMAIFLGAAVAALFFLIASMMLGGWGFIAGLLACMLVMWAVVKCEEHKKQKALAKWHSVGYNVKVWGV